MSVSSTSSAAQSKQPDSKLCENKAQKVQGHVWNNETKTQKTLSIKLKSALSSLPKNKQSTRKRAINQLTSSYTTGIQKEDTSKVKQPLSGFEKAYNLCKQESYYPKKDLPKSSQGHSLLIASIFRRDFSIAEKLIKQNIALFEKDFNGNTAMHHAALSGEINLLAKLWDANLGIDTPNKLGQTPLHLAAQNGRPEAVKTLLENGATTSAVGNWQEGHTLLEGLPPLAFAILGSNKKTLAAFFAYHKENPSKTLQIRCGNLGNILHLAIQFCRYDILQYLLEKELKTTKPLLEERTPQGLTPFMLAASMGDQPALFFLKEKKANLEATDHQGNTAMHHAARAKDPDTIKYLYALGCKLNPFNHEGKTPTSLIEDTKTSPTKNTLLNLNKQKQIQKLKPPQFTLHPPENLVFKGGGPKGIAYVGVVQTLEQENQLQYVRRVAGTSAGAINACLMALGYTGEETQAILNQTDLMSFLDHPLTKENLKNALSKNFGKVTQGLKTLYSFYKSITNPMAIAGEVLKKLWTTTGVCDGEVFRKWIEEKVEAQTNIKNCTFGELKKLIDKGVKGKKGQTFRHLYVYATSLQSEAAITCINTEDKKWEKIIISDAIRASMSIPGAFKPHILHWKNEKDERHPRQDLGSFADGGMLYNFPLETFDKKKYQSTIPLSKEQGNYHQLNKRTLGFSLYNPNDPEPTTPPPVETVGDLLKGIMGLYFSAETQIRSLTPYNKFRIIHISNEGVGTLEFSLSKEQKVALIHAGKKGTQRFFKNKARTNPSSLFVIPCFKTKKTLSSNVKPTHPDFYGRESQLQTLKNILIPTANVTFVNKNILIPKEESSSSSSSSTNAALTTATLWGDGGMGKSETAVTFANKNKDSFSFIYWIDASTDTTYGQSYRSLAKALDVYFDPKDSLEDIRKRVHYKLKAQKTKKPFLLIFDNVEKPLPLPHQGNGALLLTTRTKSLAKKAPIRMTPFLPKESETLLTHILKTHPTNNIKILAQKLDHYPLALTQAAHYIQDTPTMTVEKYLKRLEKAPEITYKTLTKDHRYPHSLMKSWLITQEQLAKSHPLALKFLQICAYLHPDSIPLTFLQSWITTNHPQKNPTEQELLVEEVLRTLVDFGLIRMNENENILSLHRFRQTVIQIALKSVIPKREALSLVAREGESLDRNKMEDWSHFKLWSPHANMLLKQAPQNKDEVKVRNTLGAWECLQGNYRKAEKLLRSGLPLADKNFGKNSVEKAKTINLLGLALSALGRHKEALEYYQKALKIGQEKLGERHPDVATSLNNVGYALGYLGRHKEALEYQQKALKIRQEKLGERHPDVAQSLNNFGLALGNLGRHKEALEYYQKAFNLAKETLGENHPMTQLYKRNLDTAQTNAEGCKIL